MKNTLLIVLTIAFSQVGMAQLKYSKVKIHTNVSTVSSLNELGITLDHIKQKPNHWVIADLSSFELDLLAGEGIAYKVLIDDLTAYYQAHKDDRYESDDREDCGDLAADPHSDPEVPENFGLGSMAGYFTYEEFLAELDEMFELYPELITEKTGIEGYQTWEDRPIHWVKISDNPTVDEDEHEVLYSAIHHAREPMSLSQTIFYMWYLLENYGTNEEVTYLVDHTELFFIPMLNPDGYKYNQTTNPGGGGMHRKNRNPDVGTSNKGVDLNRNYSYHWNETGTSPYENGDTYAGDEPFSEPETSAMRAFCLERNFQFAFNAHSHGDQLLFPIGWTYDEYAEDHDYFQAYSSFMARFNQYDAIKSSDLYPASGDSDDWMYVEELAEKPEIFAMTPEIGDSFWPPSDAILPTCKEMIWPNLMLAHLPHIYGVSTDQEPGTIENTTGHLNYTIHRYGYEDGDITVSITPLVGFETIGEPNNHDLWLNGQAEDSIAFTLSPDINFGDEIKYVLNTGTDLWMHKDTITKIYNEFIPVFFDPCEDIDLWTGEWNFTDETFYSPEKCITDSPYDPTYGNNVNKEIQLDESFDFSDLLTAIVRFHAKWEIENDYDYVQFMISVDEGESWQPLCGKYTNTGVYPQDVGEPLYDGVQNEWVLEEIDLNDFIGFEDVRFKFRLITDGGLQMDGFYFDDFGVYATVEDDTYISENNSLTLRIYPNPAQDYLVVKINDKILNQGYEIYNEIGQLVIQADVYNTKIDISKLQAGSYILRLKSDQAVLTERFTIIR